MIRISSKFTTSLLLVALALALGTGAAQAQTRSLSTQGQALDSVAAVVNDGVVLKSEVDNELALVTARLRAQHAKLPPQSVLQHQVLQQLITQELELQQAKQDGLTVPDQAVNNAIEEIAQRNGLTLDQMPNALAAQGVNYASYRRSVRRQLVFALLRQRDVIERITVTSREINRYLAREARSPSASMDYKISHILISVPQSASPTQLKAARQRAQKVDQLARSGEDFAKLAIQYSNSDTALKGGALGWRRGTELPTFLSNAILKLKPGQVSEPIRAANGFNIVRLDAERNVGKRVLVEEVHVRHILMHTNALEDNATIKEKLNQLRKEIQHGASFAALAQANSQDPGSAGRGGSLGWMSPDALSPNFRKVVKHLKVGEVSKPFHTRYGWHIAEVTGRRRVDSTNQLRRERAEQEIRASKADEQTELWLQRMRDEAYVRYMM